MDISNLKELGVAGVAIVVIAYICFRLIKELAESRINYTNFVQENNHTTTELVISSPTEPALALLLVVVPMIPAV